MTRAALLAEVFVSDKCFRPKAGLAISISSCTSEKFAACAGTGPKRTNAADESIRYIDVNLTPEIEMLLFQLPPREVAWEKEPETLEYPLRVTIEVSLLPPELFGTAEFTDTMRFFPGGEDGTQNIIYRGNLFQGAVRVSTEEPVRFPKFHFDGTFAGALLEIDGDVATFNGICDDLLAFYRLIQNIVERFASSFACVTTTPVSIFGIKGMANQHPFHVRLKNLALQTSGFSIEEDFHSDMQTGLAQYCGRPMNYLFKS